MTMPLSEFTSILQGLKNNELLDFINLLDTSLAFCENELSEHMNKVEKIQTSITSMQVKLTSALQEYHARRVQD